MATHIIPCRFTLPDTSGNVYVEPASVGLQANDRYPLDVVAFLDTATRIGMGFIVRVPQNYVGTPAFLIEWATTATSGNADWEIDYTAVADAESLDPSADQENLGAVVAAPGTARLRKSSSISATAGNFAAGDLVMGTLFRDGSESDTIAATLWVPGLYFSYADA